MRQNNYFSNIKLQIYTNYLNVQDRLLNLFYLCLQYPIKSV